MSRESQAIDDMREADVPDVAAIEFASFPKTYPAIVGGAEQLTQLQRVATQLRDELCRPWARIWVARQGDVAARPLAFLLAWHVVDELHVLNVATHPSYRRRGLGGALLEHAVGFARRNGVRHVLLEVRRSNAGAVALYRRLGFFARGLRRRYYPDDEDAVEMALLLDPSTGEVVARSDEVKLDG